MEDVRAMLAERIEGRTYPAWDLYQRYAQIARAAGRTPASRNALGRRLREMGCHRVLKKEPKARDKSSHWTVVGSGSPVQPRTRASAPQCGSCGIPLGRSSISFGTCFGCRQRSGVSSTS